MTTPTQRSRQRAYRRLYHVATEALDELKHWMQAYELHDNGRVVPDVRHHLHAALDRIDALNGEKP